MSYLGDPSQDAYRGSVEQGSAAPLMGFMDGLDAAWTAQTKVHSFLAIEQSMRAIEQSQIKKMREAGLRPHASLDDSEDLGTGPLGGAQFRQGRYSAAAQAVVDGGGWYTDEMVAERDKQIESLKKDRPDLELMTYAEMFEQVRKQSQEIEKRNAGPKTLMGEVGSFIGSAAGGMNPVSDPLNAATMLNQSLATFVSFISGVRKYSCIRCQREPYQSCVCLRAVSALSAHRQVVQRFAAAEADCGTARLSA